MFCPECGTKNDDQALFCENCGTKLRDAAPVMENQTGAKPAYLEKLEHMEKSQMIAIIVAVIAVLLFYVAFRSQYGAKHVAEQYVKAVYTQNWGEVYDALDVKKGGEFATKEAFVTARTINAEEKPDMFSIESVTENNTGETGKGYLIRFTTEKGTESRPVNLKRSGLTWKVVAEDYDTIKYSILVPKGATVKIDKIQVPEEYKAKGEKGQDLYTIDKMYGRTHYVELSGGGIDGTGQLVTGVEDSPTSVHATYSKSQLKKVSEQACEDLKTILGAAATNQKFSDVSLLNDMETTNKQQVINKYDMLRNYTMGYGNGVRTFVSYNLTNVEADASVEQEYDQNVVKVELKGNAETKNDFYAGTDSAGTDYTTGTDVADHFLYYVKDGKNWKLFDMEIDL